MSYEKEREVEAPFNMAIATLKRLDNILQQIRNNDQIYPRDSAEKQRAYIGLVKHFYINAVPLFPEGDEDLKKLGDEILNFKVSKTKKIKSGSQSEKYLYSENVDRKLNEMLIRIQIKLKKFFMPSKRDTEGLI